MCIRDSFKVGDIIKDERFAMLVEKIGATTLFSELPMSIYYGIELKKKDLKPKLNGGRVSIFGNSGVSLVKAKSDVK